MKGKTVLVTGAGSGIGLETADSLAQQGASLVLIEQDRERGKAATERIEKSGANVRLFLSDLSLQGDVRRVAAEILVSTPRIDVLINNAGAWFDTRALTVDGLERTFALNHMAYFLLTNLLLPRIVANETARIISVSSDGHAEAHLDFEDLQSAMNYSGRAAYCRSKLANILFTRALARRLQGTGVTANCLHPGRVLTRFLENIGLPLSNEEREAKFTALGYIEPVEGAKTSIYLASSAEVEGITGKYFEACRVTTPSAAAQDDVAAERLWAESVRLSKLTTDENLSYRSH